MWRLFCQCLFLISPSFLPWKGLLRTVAFPKSFSLIHLNLNGSNTDGSFTVYNSKSFFESLGNSSDSSRKQTIRTILVFLFLI